MKWTHDAIEAEAQRLMTLPAAERPRAYRQAWNQIADEAPAMEQRFLARMTELGRYEAQGMRAPDPADLPVSASLELTADDMAELLAADEMDADELDEESLQSLAADIAATNNGQDWTARVALIPHTARYGVHITHRSMPYTGIVRSAEEFAEAIDQLISTH